MKKIILTLTFIILVPLSIFAADELEKNLEASNPYPILGMEFYIFSDESNYGSNYFFNYNLPYISLNFGFGGIRDELLNSDTAYLSYFQQSIIIGATVYFDEIHEGLFLSYNHFFPYSSSINSSFYNDTTSTSTYQISYTNSNDPNKSFYQIHLGYNFYGIIFGLIYQNINSNINGNYYKDSSLVSNFSASSQNFAFTFGLNLTHIMYYLKNIPKQTKVKNIGYGI